MNNIKYIPIPEGTTEVSVGTYCVGVKPEPKDHLGKDNNGWYHIFSTDLVPIELISYSSLREESIKKHYAGMGGTKFDPMFQTAIIKLKPYGANNL